MISKKDKIWLIYYLIKRVMTLQEQDNLTSDDSGNIKIATTHCNYKKYLPCDQLNSLDVTEEREDLKSLR